ncbi:MAG: hypothetical protein IJ418_05155 [Clostridia bacterium]|nr:hypothetical protein [Clostridia bacterium]
MLFLLESIGACVLFTLMLRIVMAGRQTAFVNDYPPVVTEKLRQLNLIAQKPPARKKDVIRKIIAVIVYAVAFALLLRYVNRIESFLPAMITAYGLWLAVAWYDFLVIDVLLAPFDKFYKASGVSAFEPSAVRFHFKASLRGTIIGLGFSPVVGLLVALL